MTDTPLADEMVARLVQAGQTDQFGVLMERYENKLRRYARKFLFGRDDSDDLLQEVFIKAYTNIQSFDPSRRFSPWLYRIAHNEFVNALKKRERESLYFFDPEIIFPKLVAKETADEETNREEVKRLLDRSLDQISAKYREVLILYYYEDLDYQTIAEILQVPVGTVGVRLKRGRDELKKFINKID